jgi:hypothetical protein
MMLLAEMIEIRQPFLHMYGGSVRFSESRNVADRDQLEESAPTRRRFSTAPEEDPLNAANRRIGLLAEG